MSKSYNISGIQQVGVGVSNVKDAFKNYKQMFGMNLPVFDESAEANLMLPYTGGKPQKRHAILAMNLLGGGGFEIWQYTNRVPEAPKFPVELGDLGIFATKIKSKDVAKSFDRLSEFKVKKLISHTKNAANQDNFYVSDAFGNYFEIIESDNWFWKNNTETGGVAGVIIGVSDIDKSVEFYKNILKYDTVVYDKTGMFDDFKDLPGGNKNFRRVLLTHSEERTGAFSKLLGKTSIELVQAIDYSPKKIFDNRFWGDLGFIHLCFDIQGIDSLREECKKQNTAFTVDSSESFDMGNAAGHFAYIEDPDGTLIEFVETHKVPIAEKFGIYLNLKKRNPNKRLPDWMIKMLSLKKEK